jgi:hypothetical protein
MIVAPLTLHPTRPSVVVIAVETVARLLMVPPTLAPIFS